MQGAKNMVYPQCPRHVILSDWDKCEFVFTRICRTSKQLGHNSSAHFSGQESTFSSFQLAQLGQVELKVGQGKEKTLLPTGQVHLKFFYCPGYLPTGRGEEDYTLAGVVCINHGFERTYWKFQEKYDKSKECFEL